MATANIDLVDGTRVVIQGTPEEIARVLELYARGSPSPGTSEAGGRRLVRTAARSRNGAMQQIRALISEGFFAQRQSISAVRAKLEELGHIYPLTHLSTPLRRLVLGKELRRLRDGRNWTYVDAQ